MKLPLVLVNRDPGALNDNELQEIVRVLPNIVAKALTCDDPDGKLTERDVEVLTRDFGPFDTSTKDFEIIIWANLYPERQKNLNSRTEEIYLKLSSFTPRRIIKGFVWVLLQPGSFREF